MERCGGNKLCTFFVWIIRIKSAKILVKRTDISNKSESGGFYATDISWSDA